MKSYDSMNGFDIDECLEAAEDAELVCCVCGEGIVPDSEYRCVATDHGPDYCCEDCEYTGDE